MGPQRLPPPWSVGDLGACFVLRDANRQALGYFYSEEEPGRRSAASCWDFARRANSRTNLIAVTAKSAKPNKVAEFAKIIIDEVVNWIFQEVIGTI